MPQKRQKLTSKHVRVSVSEFMHKKIVLSARKRNEEDGKNKQNQNHCSISLEILFFYSEHIPSHTFFVICFH